MSGAGFVVDRRDVLVMTAAAAVGTACVAEQASALPVEPVATGNGRGIAIDTGWRFIRAADNTFSQPYLDDSTWRRVDLPHDWSVEDVPGGTTGPFDPAAVGAGDTGFTVGGEGWYRKHLNLAALPADRRVEIVFGGAYDEADVWLNGMHLGRNVHGYRSFAFDLTPHLKRDGNDVISVRVRNLGQNSRWYAGSGLYRGVTLDVMPAGTRLCRFGTGMWTRAIEQGRAVIDVDTRIDAPAPGVTLRTRLRDETGRTAAQVQSAAAANVRQTLTVQTPRLWSPDTPNLYTLETVLLHDGIEIDRMAQPVGIRIVTFDAKRGMSINGVATKLRGGCVHHDNALLGACAFADADDRRVRLLKARGFNAIRSAHNPASTSLRNACDRQGMLLIEEAFDVWHVAKKPQDFSVHFREHWQDVIETMVLEARNSPSVIMWSIGNEIPDRATEEGQRWAWTLANAVKRIDPTRPVTAAINGMLGTPVVAGPGTAIPGRENKVEPASIVFLDIPGYNYRLEDIVAEHAADPQRIVYASESFARDVFAYRRLMDTAPYFLGEFVWTAMDYIGEAGLGATVPMKQDAPPYFVAKFPWVNAWCGDLDLIGEQKASSLARDVAWGRSALEMLVHPPVAPGMIEYVAGWGWPDERSSWTWPAHVGQTMGVRLYTAGDRVELRLDGRVVATKTVSAADNMKVEIPLPFAPGMLEANAYRDGRLIGTRRLATVGVPRALRLVEEQASQRRGREALAYVRVEVVDAAGRVVPDADNAVTLTLDGAAELIAFGAAGPLAQGSLKATATKVYRGKALLVLRGAERRSPTRLTVAASGLDPASRTITLG